MRLKLKEMRLEKSLTQKELAEKIGIDRATYTNIELGYKNPSLEVAIKIKKELNYIEDDIFLKTKCRYDTITTSNRASNQ